MHHRYISAELAALCNFSKTEVFFCSFFFKERWITTTAIIIFSLHSRAPGQICFVSPFIPFSIPLYSAQLPLLATDASTWEGAASTRLCWQHRHRTRREKYRRPPRRNSPPATNSWDAAAAAAAAAGAATDDWKRLLWVFLWQCLSWLLWGVRTKQSASILPQKFFAIRGPHPLPLPPPGESQHRPWQGTCSCSDFLGWTRQITENKRRRRTRSVQFEE